MTRNPSPLRYPGGKFKICKLIELLVRKSDAPCECYVEPFAGGAGVALQLLLSGVVRRIVINDSDRAISSIWNAMTQETDAFVERINEVDLSLDEWNRQREIFFRSPKYSFDYGFAAFYLNRTNHSGILSAGPIGGRAQRGLTLAARFNRAGLADRVRTIGEHRDCIKVYNRDVFSFIRNQLPRQGRNAFVYFDPPYYRRGKVLYKNYFTRTRHEALKNAILDIAQCPWIVTYDDVPEIRDIYRDIPCRTFNLNYSLANNGTGREVMFFSNARQIPTEEDLAPIRMNRNFGFDDLIFA